MLIVQPSWLVQAVKQAVFATQQGILKVYVCVSMCVILPVHTDHMSLIVKHVKQ